MGLTANGFGQLTEQVMQLADRWTGGKAGFILEGGYNLTGLALSVLGTIQTLIQEQAASIPEPVIKTADESQLDDLLARIQTIQPLL